MASAARAKPTSSPRPGRAEGEVKGELAKFIGCFLTKHKGLVNSVTILEFRLRSPPQSLLLTCPESYLERGLLGSEISLHSSISLPTWLPQTSQSALPCPMPPWRGFPCPPPHWSPYPISLLSTSLKPTCLLTKCKLHESGDLVCSGYINNPST